MKFAKRLLSVCICLSMLMLSITTDAVTKKERILTLAPSSQGEYNMTIEAYCTSSPVLYQKNILGKLIRATGYKMTHTGGKYIIKSWLSRKNYYIKFAPVGTYRFSYAKNLDVYSHTYGKVTRGLQWKPTSKQLSTSSLYKQVCYLTNYEAAIYALGLNQKIYLKLLDESVSLSAVLACASISKTSALGRAIIALGKKPLVEVAKRIVSIYGYSIPSLSTSIKDTIRRKTNNFKSGLRITVVLSHGTYVDCYDSWNQQSSTVKGIVGMRGNFSTLRKVESWY